MNQSQFEYRATAIVFALFAGLLGLPFILISLRSSPPSISVANGVYYNPCCGRIILSDGLMRFNGGQARYTLSSIKGELVLSADRDVGIEGGHAIRMLPKRNLFWVKPSVSPPQSKLLEFEKRPPNRLGLLSTDRDHSWYIFERE